MAVSELLSINRTAGTSHGTQFFILRTMKGCYGENTPKKKKKKKCGNEGCMRGLLVMTGRASNWQDFPMNQGKITSLMMEGVFSRPCYKRQTPLFLAHSSVSISLTAWLLYHIQSLVTYLSVNTYTNPSVLQEYFLLFYFSTLEHVQFERGSQESLCHHYCTV